MTPAVEKRRAFIINIAYYGIILAAFYLVFKTFSGVLMPFITAFIIAALLHRPIKFITEKTPLKRNIPSIIGVFLLFTFLAGILFLIGWALFTKLKEFSGFLVDEMKNLSGYAEQVRGWLIPILEKLPESFSHDAVIRTNAFFDDLIKNGFQSFSLNDFSINWSSVLSTGGSAIKQTVGQIPSMLISFVITIVASVFLTIDYDIIKAFVMRQFSEEKQRKIRDGAALAKSTLGKMFKAYGKIMCVTFAEMCIGLGILKLIGVYTSSYLFLIAAITTVVDIIPVLGTGTVLIPWAIISFISGKIGLGIGLLIMYVVIFVIRQIIEPKLVAGQVGLPPIITITAMYIGTKTLGVLGFFILPFVVIILKELNAAGILHWFRLSDSADESAGNMPDEAAGAEEETVSVAENNGQ